MAIIDKPAACIIPGAGSRVSVNVVLDCTDSADFTSYRQGQPEFCFRSCSWATRNQKNDDDTRGDRTPQSCCRRSQIIGQQPFSAIPVATTRSLGSGCGSLINGLFNRSLLGGNRLTHGSSLFLSTVLCLRPGNSSALNRADIQTFAQ